VRRPYDALREKNDADFETALAAVKFSLSVNGWLNAITFTAKGCAGMVTCIKELFVEHMQTITSKYIENDDMPTVRYLQRFDKGSNRWVLDFYVRFNKTEKRLLEIVTGSL
jgi:hypothetical protein